MRQIRSILSNIACLTIGCVALAACTTSTDPTPIASILLTPGIDSIEIGQTFDSWIVIVKDANGNSLEGRRLVWESKNTTVATIDPNTGVVTGVGSGETAIVVKAEGKESIASMRVLLPVMGVVAIPDSMDIPLTTSRQINVQVIGPEGTALTNRAVAFSSDDPATAVVSGTGVVTPLKLGTTSIKIRVAGILRATVRVRVIGEPVTGVRILPLQSIFLIRLGQTKQLSAECLSASNQVLPGRPLVWNSTNPIAASVDQTGLVTGVSLGGANITVTCDNTANGAVGVTITPVRVASAEIIPGTLDVRFGTQAQLNVVARDSIGTVLSILNRTLVWTTNNFPVATVTQQGLVTGNGPGTAEIRVSVDGVDSPPAIITVFNPGALASSVPAWVNSRRSSGLAR
jgi:uncharacterized protein YjdB